MDSLLLLLVGLLGLGGGVMNILGYITASPRANRKVPRGVPAGVWPLRRRGHRFDRGGLLRGGHLAVGGLFPAGGACHPHSGGCGRRGADSLRAAPLQPPDIKAAFLQKEPPAWAILIFILEEKSALCRNARNRRNHPTPGRKRVGTCCTRPYRWDAPRRGASPGRPASRRPLSQCRPPMGRACAGRISMPAVSRVPRRSSSEWQTGRHFARIPSAAPATHLRTAGRRPSFAAPRPISSLGRW